MNVDVPNKGVFQCKEYSNQDLPGLKPLCVLRWVVWMDVVSCQGNMSPFDYSRVTIKHNVT